MKSLNDKSGRVRLLLNFSGPILRQVFLLFGFDIILCWHIFEKPLEI